VSTKTKPPPSFHTIVILSVTLAFMVVWFIALTQSCSASFDCKEAACPEDHFPAVVSEPGFHLSDDICACVRRPQ